MSCKTSTTPLIAQNARYMAERWQSQLELPAELMARNRRSAGQHPCARQQFLFRQPHRFYQSQSAVLGQRVEQQQSQVQCPRRRSISVTIDPADRRGAHPATAR